MQLAEKIGLRLDGKPQDETLLRSYANLRLASLGLPTIPLPNDQLFNEISGALLAHYREAQRLLSEYLCPADQRIQDFLDSYLGDTGVSVRLPTRTFILDRYGLARTLSLPPDRDEFVSDIVTSYRVKQGVLHNPKSDRRTTKGVFHIAEGGAPIPDDKLAVPKEAFARLLSLALLPPPESLTIPFTSTQAVPAECFVSLLLRPMVCPEVPGFFSEKSMETRFFAPGTLVSNLDFVESIFGNGGDPFLPENDAGLDVEHWVGHTGCVILAPHLTRVRKKDVGLPHWDQATERQRRDGMCWKAPEEFYNTGTAFKVTCRDRRGVIVTVIADNYFGYCKKEVKTQISYSANLFGLAEEEHAGGARVFPSYDLGEVFTGTSHEAKHTFRDAIKILGESVGMEKQGYAIDKKFPNIIYVPEDSVFDLYSQSITWTNGGTKQTIKLLADKVYVRPSGYRVQMEKPPGKRAWRLVGAHGNPTLCHKPCTVSGGGKSEISKSIFDAIIQGPVFISDFQRDFDAVAKLMERDFSDRFADPPKRGKDHRDILSPERSLGSVIKLLTPDNEEYRSEYNDWLETIPQHIKELVFVVKRFYKPEWDGKWRDHFSVDVINGEPGNELKCNGRKLVSNYLRVGFAADGSWRVFGLRKDFHPAAKVQAEDDITASLVVPGSALPNAETKEHSVKIVQNCEGRLFQRPDDAIHRGYDKATERDFARSDNFFSNYEPLTPKQARELVEDAIGFNEFTAPLRKVIAQVAETGKPSFFVSSAHPRIVEGKPSKNPRYLQGRPDLLNPQSAYLAEVGERLHRAIPVSEPMITPVTVVLPGRRNNPPDAGIRPLAVYNPIHYMELPELFMEFICSMTGKSPSTTGAGSEGALTKGPFNALPPIIDLNNAFVSYVLCSFDTFVTAAGYVGPNCRVDHDVSLLIPEVWSRMNSKERDARFLIESGYLEKLEDFEVKGKRVQASKLGYRITQRFVNRFFGRILSHPHIVFTEEMLRPELQDKDIFADGMDNIVQTQKRVAEHYFNDGSIEMACPPLRALLHIMRDDQFGGMHLNSPDFRKMFTRDHLLNSEWYSLRITKKQELDSALWNRHVRYLEAFLQKGSHSREATRLCVGDRLNFVQKQIELAKGAGYRKQLWGTIGVDPAGHL